MLGASAYAAEPPPTPVERGSLLLKDKEYAKFVKGLEVAFPKGVERKAVEQLSAFLNKAEEIIAKFDMGDAHLQNVAREELIPRLKKFQEAVDAIQKPKGPAAFKVVWNAKDGKWVVQDLKK